MPTVSELLMDAIKFDEIFMAYSIYFAVNEGLLQTTDDEKRISEIEFPEDEIRAAIKSDSLKLQANMIKLYFVKYQDDYAIYLARDSQEVARLHLILFKESAKQIIDRTHKKDTEIYDMDKKRYMSFRDIQKSTLSFPHFVCVMGASKKR